jgi:hypothetical protein
LSQGTGVQTLKSHTGVKQFPMADGVIMSLRPTAQSNRTSREET